MTTPATTPTLEKARQERARLLAEEAERQRILSDLAAVEQKIAEGEAQKRAAQFARIVARIDALADAADGEQSRRLARLNGALAALQGLEVPLLT